jgi:hypothetical protein
MSVIEMVHSALSPRSSTNTDHKVLLVAFGDLCTG